MGGASRWYYSLDLSKTKVWSELVELFVDQFFNTMIVVTLRDLQTTKQGVRETFSKYMNKWSISQMRWNKSTRTCFRLIIIGLCHCLLAHLENYVIVAQELKMPSTMDNWRKVKVSLHQENVYGGGATTTKAPNPVNVRAIIP